jgi:hypothetical protein
MSGLETRAARNVVIVSTATKLARIYFSSLDDIAKDHVTHSDRRADDSGQKKVETADDR